MTEPHTTVCEKGPGEYHITLTFRDNAKLEKVISEKDKELAEARATIAGKDRELAEAHGKISQQEKEIEEKSDKLQLLVTQNRISDLCFDEAVRDVIKLKRKIEDLEAELAGNRAAKRAAHVNKAGEGCSRGDVIVID